jgi:hypothetical protein
MDSIMKKISFPAKWVLIPLLTLLIEGCQKDDETPDPNAIPPGSIRITATINAPGVQSNDVYRVAGLFASPNNWSNLANMYIMTKQADGTYSIIIPGDVMLEDPPPRFHFRISRNGQLAERDANCQEIGHEIWKTHYLGKEYRITVEAFQGTGNCPL